MWWLLGVAVIVIILAFFEWRSWKKPMPGRLEKHWTVNNGRDTGGAIAGGNTFDGRHD